MLDKFFKISKVGIPLVFFILLTAGFLFINQANASNSVSLKVGGLIPYSNFATNWFSCDGNAAYCLDPKAPTPKPGSYTSEELNAPSGKNDELAGDLYFSYGAPGFSKDMWPKSWHDGTPMTPARYSVAAHILLSDTFKGGSEYVFYGCGAGFKKWAFKELLGHDERGKTINEDATAKKILARLEEVPDAFHPMQIYTGKKTQTMIGFSYVPYGSIELTKRSSYENLSNNNDCYSLKDAKYGVYSDSDLQTCVTYLITDANGYAQAEKISPGKYWVKEIEPSMGMALDDTVYSIEVQPEKKSLVNDGVVYDKPQSNPVKLVLNKLDDTSGKNKGQGNASLEGALFRLSYFDGFYDSLENAQQSKKPKATWVFETDANGEIYYSSEYLKSGSELFLQSDGKTPCIPLGTIAVEEISAPVGYELNTSSQVIKITGDKSSSESVSVYNSFECKDVVSRGDYRLFKEVRTKKGEDEQAMTRIALEGIKFEIYNESNQDVISPETLNPVKPGDLLLTITTNEEGFASTKSYKPNEWQGALAYGEYRIHEVITEEVFNKIKDQYGISMETVPDWNISISKNEQYDPIQVVANKTLQTAISIVKLDETTDKKIPLPCSFKIYDSKGTCVTYEDHVQGKTIDTWVTQESGHVTLPMMLDGGTYTLKEIEAPEGYKINENPISFTVDSYHGWKNPLEIVCKDEPVKGSLVLTKVNFDNEKQTIEGTTYGIYAAEDITTGDGTVRHKKGDCIKEAKTDSEGKLIVEDLFLGSYDVKELACPDGWVLDEAVHRFNLEEGTEYTESPVKELVLSDKPTKLRVLKKQDSEEEVFLAGAEFELNKVSESGEIEKNLGVYISDEKGLIEIANIKQGFYILKEIKAPSGCVLDDEITLKFEVNNEGKIGLSDNEEFSDTLETIIENKQTELFISKKDVTSGEELPGATLELYTKKGSLVESWVSEDEPHCIRGLTAGDYVLTEKIAPEGYLLSEKSVDIAFDPNQKTDPVVMENDYTKVSISKIDDETGELLPGAKLALFNEEREKILEWESEKEPTLFRGLPVGKYTLKEMAAPEGYLVAEDVEFEITKTADLIEINLKDKRVKEEKEEIIKLPSTGDPLFWGLVSSVIGATSLSVIGGILFFRRKKQKNMQRYLDNYLVF